MTEHDLKTWPVPFASLWNGSKKHELRINDRDYKVGDRLRLKEFDPRTLTYLGRWVLSEVTYITDEGAWGLPSHLCVMSIQELSRSK